VRRPPQLIPNAPRQHDKQVGAVVAKLGKRGERGRDVGQGRRRRREVVVAVGDRVGNVVKQVDLCFFLFDVFYMMVFLVG
jgi:hypothetical protein